ncbi:hypothetical protein [Niabella hirudinis]|uniref:hypothetical protein n=1 Tax=Niabella hirudinis TaxID=1285929 RepID=UPI003EBC931D
MKKCYLLLILFSICLPGLTQLNRAQIAQALDEAAAGWCVFLVSEMKAKAIMDEGDMLAVEKLDDYINGRADTVDYIGGLRPMLSDRELLQWLRNFNKDKAETDRYRFGKNDFEVGDRYMFENIKKIAERIPGGKLILNAHSGHLQKTKFMTLKAGFGWRTIMI